MTDSFFGYNTALTGFEEGLHDDPGQGLDEEAEEYDALNDQTFGLDSLDGDWEQDHEKLAQITERSRVHRSSYNSATDAREDDLDDRGFEDLDLEASLSQLVTEDFDEVLVENKKPKTHRHMGAGVLEGGYSCSPPSQVNVWGVQRQDQQQALKPHNLLPAKKYCTVEELERNLKQNSTLIAPKKPPSAMRLEDLERDLTSSKHKVPPGFSRPMFPPPMHQDVTVNGIPPGFGPPRNMAVRGPFPPQLLVPPGMDFRHRPMGPGPGPNVFRFMPPHLMMAAQQFPPRHNFRQPYPMGQQGGPPMNRGPPPRGMMGPRYPIGRPNGDPRRDEYDGLMNDREVQWLLNIQQINITTAQPYVDDYYFTVYSARHPRQPGDHRRTRERRDSHRDCRNDQPQPGLQQRVYTPLQFENSLGKLQCGSVTAPRKIIDMEVVSTEVADPAVAQSSQRDTRKAKQLLLTIEQLYLVLLQLEDLESPLATGGTVPDPTTDKVSLIQRICSTLNVEDRLQATMCIRKGKVLVMRLLKHLTPADHSAWLLNLWSTVLRGFVAIARRDSEPGVLPRFYPHFKLWLDTADLAALETLARALRPQSPARNVLAYALGNKFGVSALLALVLQADRVPELTSSPDWSMFLRDLTEAWATPVPARATPVDTVDRETLSRHLAPALVESLCDS